MSNFVDDETDLPGPKIQGTPIPEDEEDYGLSADEYNTVRQGSYDMRGAIIALREDVAALSGGGGGGAPSDFGETIRVATAFGGNFATATDWTPAGYVSTTKVIVITSQDGGSQFIGGLTGGVDGRIVTIQKILSGGAGYPGNIPYTQGLSFTTEHGASTDINRFAANFANASFGTRPSSFTIRYDGTIHRWIPLCSEFSNS